MLTCIACSKQIGGGSLHEPPEEDDFAPGSGGGATTPSTKHAVKTLTAQLKDMAVKASGAYRHCKPCTGSTNHRRYSESEPAGSDRFYHCAYKRAGPVPGLGIGFASANSTPRLIGSVSGNLGSSGEATPASMSGRTESEAAAPSELLEEDEEAEGKEWVAQVEPGVLITFVALPRGGNDLRRIRFSREMFDKWQAQRWWAENYEKVMELYNVQRFNRNSVPLPTPPRSEDESSKEDSPVTPPLGKERLPRNFNHRPPTGGGGMGSSSSDSLDHPHHHRHGPHHRAVLASTPKLSSISGAKTDDASMRTTSSSHGEDEETETEADRSEDMSVSISNASDQEREWVEEDEPGVYITIRALPGGVRELRRVRFSRERFTEMHARLWWEENRARIHDQYL
ncbi:hypothetical protein LUZ63_007206 [Rhynchospora breviuscula]|uniref:BRX domain-containing protein n=1 Tax=Rhynchospora breviuscula TaxID=2022672 RepID=A0A9Q0CR86_9POAL|nr:hypothetical protein LUZ63_007206 [Rhynchospora breviuscula]